MKFFPLLLALVANVAVAGGSGPTSPLKTGTFEQSKQLVGLSRTLNSSGRFAINENAVTWTTTAPLFSEVRISGDAVSERYTPNGEFQVTAQGESVTTVSRVLALIVQNDIAGLERYFEVQVRDQDAGKDERSLLTPRSAALKKLFSLIAIQQSGDTADVHITETAGSTTHIRLLTNP